MSNLDLSVSSFLKDGFDLKNHLINFLHINNDQLDQRLIKGVDDLAALHPGAFTKDDAGNFYEDKVGDAQALTNVGAKVIKVKTAKELEKAINRKTAMLWFLNANTGRGEIKWKEFVALGKKHNIPTFIDCAADIPPVENLFRFTKMGFDMVAFSGGKGLRGPQSAGLLLGKREYIEAARLHTPPRGETIGRGMKVNKEEVLGMLAALELYLSRDHDAEWKVWEDQINMIADAAKSVGDVETKISVPEYANCVPTLRIKWDQNKLKISPDQLRKQLRDGDPSIQTVGDKNSVGITTWMMVPGQETIVSQKIKSILENSKNS